jgi:hypothetical protein
MLKLRYGLFVFNVGSLKMSEAVEGADAPVANAVQSVTFPSAISK